MDWSITVPEGDGIVEAVVSGEFTMERAREMITAGLELGARYRTNRFLTDAREVISDVSTVQIYLLPKVLEALGLSRESRTALVIPEAPEREEDFRFYQTVAANQGYSVGLFHDVESARQWLMQET